MAKKSHKVSAKAQSHVALAQQIMGAIINEALAFAALEDGIDLKAYAYNPEKMEWTPRPTPPKEQ